MAFQLQEDDVIILLGAGASQEATIPITSEMIESIERELDGEWNDFKGLYDFIKKQVKTTSEQVVNIEELVSILDELLLLLSKQHPLTPFHLSWIDFIESVGYTYKFIEEFRDNIMKKLKEWIDFEGKMKAKYYQKISDFQKEYNNSLRIFTLNYDLCIETMCTQCSIERGFGDENNEDNCWDWQRFKVIDSDYRSPDIFLYKMHGSIDWERDTNGKLVHRTQSRIKKFEIIFGTRQKVRHYDPFLFFLYEFREYVLKSKIILICGYGFGDKHINDIIKQGIEESPTKLLVVNRYLGTANDLEPEEKSRIEEQDKEIIRSRLNLPNNDNIKVVLSTASDFFTSHMAIHALNAYFPEDVLPF